MKRISILTFILLGLFGQAFSQTQSIDYKVLRDLKIKFSHVFDPSTVESSIALLSVKAPMPLQENDFAKRIVDARKFNSGDLSQRREGFADLGDNLLNPKNELGYVGAKGPGTPNDNHVAVSKDRAVISTLNQRVFCMNKDGDFLKSWALYFMRNNKNNDKPEGDLPVLTRTYDPKVIYDDLNDRFILVFLNGVTENTSLIVVCFSQTNDPTGKWNVYQVEGNPLAQNKIWTDYPIIATTKEDFFVTINLLEEGKGWQDGFRQSIIWQIGKEEGYNGDSLNSNFWYDLKYADKPVWSICPVQGGAEQSEKYIHFLSVRPSDISNDTVFLHTIDNTLSSGLAKWSLKQLKTDIPYGVPASATQPKAGFRLQTNDARVLSAFKHKDIIQYVQTTSNSKNQNSAIYHGKIEGVGATERVSGKIITLDTMEYAYPSICYAGDGSFDQSSMLTFSHVSNRVFPGTSVVFCNDYNQYSEIVMIKKGEGHINSFIADTAERWGDYTNIQRKYDTPGEIWAVGSFGNSSNETSTWVAQLKIDNQSVGVGETPIILENKVYPVPAGNKEFNIELYAKSNVVYTIELYNALGAKMYQAKRENLVQGKNVLKLMNLTVVPGVYSLKMLGNEVEILSEKIILK